MAIALQIIAHFPNSTSRGNFAIEILPEDLGR
jgi:hypothetical protein